MWALECDFICHIVVLNQQNHTSDLIRKRSEGKKKTKTGLCNLTFLFTRTSTPFINFPLRLPASCFLAYSLCVVWSQIIYGSQKVQLLLQSRDLQPDVPRRHHHQQESVRSHRRGYENLTVTMVKLKNTSVNTLETRYRNIPSLCRLRGNLNHHICDWHL